MRRHYGDQRKFLVVEDLDPKGFQSGKGVRAKVEERIESWKIAVRSPGWMPLDFCLWDEIEMRTLSKPGYDNEDAASYSKRLRLTAMHLPKTLIQNCLGKLKANIEATVESQGGHTKVD